MFSKAAERITLFLKVTGPMRQGVKIGESILANFNKDSHIFSIFEAVQIIRV